MTDRESVLSSLVVGDVFHAEGLSGASLICLVTAVTEATIRSRRITTQETIEFDRRTGREITSDGSAKSTIDSAAPLPVDVHNVMLWMDRKYRLERDLEKFKLSDAEKKALCFIYDFYPANPL